MDNNPALQQELQSRALYYVYRCQIFYDARGDPDVVFPKYSGPSCPPVDYLLLEAQIKDKELEQQVLLEELQSEHAFLEKEKLKYHSRIGKCSYMEQMLQSVQVQVPAVRQGYVDS